MSAPHASAPTNVVAPAPAGSSSKKVVAWSLAALAVVGIAGGGFYAYQEAETKRIASEKAAAEAARLAEEKHRAEQAERDRLAEQARVAKGREEQARKEADALKARLAQEEANNAASKERARAVPVATAQNPAFSDAIRIFVSSQGPLSEKPKQVMQDLDGDGLPEAIVKYCVDQNMPGGKFAGANNPANAHCGLAVFKQSAGKWNVVSNLNIGHGDLRDVRGGVIYLEALVHGPKDPLCCPSLRKEAHLAMRNGTLVKVP